MEDIERLYEKLITNDEDSPSLYNIDTKIRSQIYKKILHDLNALKEKQRITKLDSDDYKRLDLEIRLRLLKEIQIIIDDYVMSKKNNELDRWKAMYGELDIYIKNFFYYRIDGKYEIKRKVLTNYKIL
ncbi:MAG: hypothetical protein SWO11_20220 [Thermodesulfobacteriota bacterium]|nr:hypothetical protein [Thermodesulfobacteriota bacterium]